MDLLHYRWFANGLAPVANVLVMEMTRIVEIMKKKRVSVNNRPSGGRRNTHNTYDHDGFIAYLPLLLGAVTLVRGLLALVLALLPDALLLLV